jgi:hypothetical protein
VVERTAPGERRAELHVHDYVHMSGRQGKTDALARTVVPGCTSLLRACVLWVAVFSVWRTLRS